jgi:hypothetical protein
VQVIAMIVGAILIVLGVATYLATLNYEAMLKNVTALIPAGLGLVLVILGLLGRNEKTRMHVMHGAVLVGLIGLVGGIANALRVVFSGGDVQGLAFLSTVAMAVICAVFVALCVKSFIDARRRRRSEPRA